MSDQLKANADILEAAKAIPKEKEAEFKKCIDKNRKAIDELPHLERSAFLDKIVAYVLRPVGTTGKMEYNAQAYEADDSKLKQIANDAKHPLKEAAKKVILEAQKAYQAGDKMKSKKLIIDFIKMLDGYAAKNAAVNNPWAIATAKVGRKNPEKYERAVKDIKKTLPGYDAKTNPTITKKDISNLSTSRKNPMKVIHRKYDDKGNVVDSSTSIGRMKGQHYDAKLIGKGDAMDRLAHEAAMFSAMSVKTK